MRLVFIFVIAFGSLTAGYLLKTLLHRWVSLDWFYRVSGITKYLVLVAPLPITILNSFWGFEFVSGRLVLLPLLGALALGTGAAAALVVIHLFRVEPHRAGSVFTCGMFSNYLVLASFVSFVLYGPAGYAYVQLFALLEPPINYGIGFPVSDQVSRATLHRFRFSVRQLLERPVTFVPTAAIAVGLLLRAAGVPRPAILPVIAGFLVPAITGILGLAIGVTIQVRAIGRYRREIALVHLIKFAVVPAVVIPVAVLFGLPQIADGVAFRATIIAAFMPVAFTAVIPPVIYGFDVDMANSAWLTTTFAFFVILPLLLLFL